MLTHEERDAFLNTQFESILISFLDQIAEGETEEIMRSLREAWTRENIILLKGFTDEKINELITVTAQAKGIDGKIGLWEKMTNMTTLRFKIQIALNEKPVLKRPSISPHSLK